LSHSGEPVISKNVDLHACQRSAICGTQIFGRILSCYSVDAKAGAVSSDLGIRGAVAFLGSEEACTSVEPAAPRSLRLSWSSRR
jgi:hypothetical protein